MAGEWLLGIGFGPTATAAATLDLAVQQVIPLELPLDVPAVPPDPEIAIRVLRTALQAAWSTRGGPPPLGLVLAYPDNWLPHQAGLLTHAAATVGYTANTLRLLPISTATAHNPTHLGDGPALAAARGALLAMLAPPPPRPLRTELLRRNPRPDPTPPPSRPEPHARQPNSQPVARQPDSEPIVQQPHSGRDQRTDSSARDQRPDSSARHRQSKRSVRVPSALGPQPTVFRTPRIWAAALVLGVVIAGGTTGVVVLAAKGDEITPAAATVGTTSRAVSSAPATTTAVTTSVATSVTTSPPAPPPPPEPPPPEPPAPTPEPPPVTTRPAPTTVQPAEPEPAPAPPDPTTQAPRDMHDATVRGYCQGLLNQADKFPGGLAAMRAQVPPPFLSSPADWSEAFDRAESGSCQ
ncbi:hypothetical protein [Nocardia yamanashiensis]|uniref:hypothetical protein n=1 Tax=Nocardia yamanashiensis TaxID=209247 RepID=UPI000A4EEA98|nr:hypothetical protein [Nocardia yamanashiensis]